jgi:cytochrome c-type biogenesis protein
MESLQYWLDNSSTPIISAFILGLMTAISPCPLATNITAVVYISKEIENKRRIFANGIVYTLGRAISYSTIGLILFFGASKFHVSKIFAANGEKFLGPLLVIIGILMLDLIPLKFPSFSKLTDKINHKNLRGSRLKALLLGIVFALAFCPYSGVLYFGLLIPMSVASSSGLFLPVVFAIATGLPVIIIAYLLAFSISSVGTFFKNIQTFQVWFNRLVAAVFIVVGIYYTYLFYFQQIVSK